jgi:hypothetical protein
MVTTGFCLLFALVVALLAGIAIRPRAIGWFVVGIGLLFLTHAGVNIAIIWAHNNEVPPYVNFYLLFATIPVGLSLVLLGIGIVCIRSCARRLRKPS